MILEAILSLILIILQNVFSWLNLPNFPDEVFNAIYSFVDFLCTNVSFLGFFIRPNTIAIALPILIILLNFERLYHFVMWILKKIPVLNIH